MTQAEPRPAPHPPDPAGDGKPAGVVRAHPPIPNSLMQRIDRVLYIFLTRNWEQGQIDGYIKGLRVDNDASDIPSVVGKTFSVIDAKASALLTHTSMMVAALGVATAVVADTHDQQAVIIIEIVFYLLISIMCLRCISLFHEPPEFDDATLTRAVQDELILRRGIYMLCNRMTIYLTLLVLVSLPVLFII